MCEKWLRLLHIRHFLQNDTWHIEKSSLANEWQYFDKISMIYILVIEW